MPIHAWQGNLLGLTRGLRAAQPPTAYSLSSKTAHAWLPRLLNMSAICSDTLNMLNLLGHMQLRQSLLHDVKHGSHKGYNGNQFNADVKADWEPLFLLEKSTCQPPAIEVMMSVTTLTGMMQHHSRW